jgi:hypothetical protein
MALNLNKNEDESKIPSSEKKGLNLSKSGDSKNVESTLNNSEESLKVKLDLTKEKLQSETKSSSPEEQSEPKKKFPLMLIVMIAVVLIGVFWYINKQNIGTPESSPVVENSVTPSDASVTQPGAGSDTISTSTQPSETVSSGQNTSTDGTQEKTNINSQNTDPVVTNTVNSGSVGTVEKKAQDVIDGVYGNGNARKRALGSEYNTIQSKVNEMYRNR